jgi:phage terminase large subunit
LTEAVLEHDYWPRKEFIDFHKRRERWAVLICHRRCGKTYACLNDLLLHAFRTPNGRYAYIAPLYNQAKGIAWDLLKQFSRPFLAHPPHEAELRCDLYNGARISLFGADNPDRLRGMGFDGVILDEFADMSPSLWGSVVRPALADRKGYAVIIGTVRGRNHLWQAYERGRQDPSWFTALLRASDTKRLSADELEDAARILSPEQYAAEFECDAAAAIQGAYWGKELAASEEANRITGVPVEAGFPVHTAWDLGVGDSTAIWFWQAIGQEIRIVDFYESHGQALQHYVAELSARGYTYGSDFVPHDAKVKELGTGRTRIETLISLGRKPVPYSSPAATCSACCWCP